MLYVENASESVDGAKPVQEDVKTTAETSPLKQPSPQKWEIIWRNVILYCLMHVAAFYGLYFVITLNVNWKTVAWTWLMTVVGLQGITSGVHRLWAHKTYKAKLPLRMLLCVFQTIALQQSIHDWATDHRVHHKYVDTNADPHNSLRGFFFCHVGWLFIKKHKDVIEKTEQIDMSDIDADPVVAIQKKYYFSFFAPVIGFFMPAFVPYYFWGESFAKSFFVASMLRYCVTTHITFMVNSVAHMFGARPYDKNLRPVENLLVTVLTGGEGWHNYHHTFPWDYKAGEFGHYKTNTSTAFIDFMAKIGQAYDLKTVSEEMVKKRALRTGDGTRKFDDVKGLIGDHEHGHGEENLWGWGDNDMKKEDLDFVKISHGSDNDAQKKID